MALDVITRLRHPRVRRPFGSPRRVDALRSAADVAVVFAARGLPRDDPRRLGRHLLVVGRVAQRELA